MFGLIRRLLGLAILVVVAYAGFRWGPLVFPRLEQALGLGGTAEAAGEGVEAPSPEVAQAALDRFEAFRQPGGATGEEGPRRLALGSVELSALVRHAIPGLLPAGVADPAVRLENGRVGVSARVAVASFPTLPQLAEVVGLLPDTVLLEMEGALVPLDQQFLALLVDRVEASRIPIPRRLVADVLAALGRQGPPALPKDALAVPIPDGVRSVYVLGDSLILESGD